MEVSEDRSVAVEKLMDSYLKSVGLHRKKIAKDGSCLFRAVAEQVLHSQSLHTEVRAKCVEFLKKNRESYEAFIEGDFEEYLCKLQDPQQWVGEVEINALAVMYKRDFLIFQEPGKPAVNITDNNFKEKVQLCFLNGNHYDSVYPISRVKNAALCQSILYELLYDGVFNVDRSALGPCQRNSRPNDLLSDDSMAACGSSDGSDLDTDEPLWVGNETNSASSRHNSHNYRGRGRGRQLPERVRRSLNPTLFRNVEYDVWQKSKRAQQKMDYYIAAGMQFSVGDRCQVRLESGGRSYSATVKEVPPHNGPVTVYIEDVGMKQVPLWSLRPPSDEGNWRTVVNRDRKISNGHGESEERGKGRGRGKSSPASSSVSQATVAGSSGRVQKQHSWPPQAAGEEQGGPKITRKSVSMVEPAFGLTEEQRMAKLEEERNVALVEIQLRDEHSFPALGSQPTVQTEGGRRKGGEKRRSQRNKTSSPVEGDRAPSPIADRPKSSTPPPGRTSSSPAPTSSTFPATKPAAPLVNSDSGRSNVMKASVPGSAPTSAAPPPKTKPGSPPLAPTPSAQRSGSHPVPARPSFPASSPPAGPASPPPSCSVPPPAFIAPIAPSPTAAQGFPRAFSPIATFPRSPTQPSSSPVPPPAQVKEAPPTNSLPKTEGVLTATQTFQSQTCVPQIYPQVSAPQSQTEVSEAEKQTQPSFLDMQTQTQVFPPQTQVTMPQMQSEAQSSVPTPHTKEAPEPQSQLQLQAEVAHLPPGAPNTLPPHPSQVPYPSLSLTASTQSSDHQNDAESQKPESPPRPPSQQSHPPQAPCTQPLPPPPQPFPGSVSLQQLSHLCQDPLYPGFPQGEKGEVSPIPPFSSSKSGTDLPQDVNILRFFFNLGVKAYTMPMFPPCLYLLPLHQAYTFQLKPSCHSPSPSYAPPTPPTRQQEPFPPSPYPPTSATVPHQYDHQPPAAEPPPSTEPPFNQTGFPAVTHPPPHGMPCSSIPWQQMPPPRNPNYPMGYPSPTLPYSGPPPSTHGYPPGQGPMHSLYPSAGSPYPPFPVGYQPLSVPEELQLNQGTLEQLQHTNGDTIPGHGSIRLLGPPEGPASVNVANANNSRPIMLPPSYEPTYRGSQKQLSVPKPYAPEPSQQRYLMTGTMAEPLSVACSTEDDLEELKGFEQANVNHLGQRRSYRPRGGGGGGGGGRGRGRGSHDAGRVVQRRRHVGEMGTGSNYVQVYSSHRGQGRGY